VSKFESAVSVALNQISAQFEQLAQAVRTALPHAPIPTGYGAPGLHSLISNLKLAGECEMADTVKMLRDTGAIIPNMPIVVNYLNDRDTAWDGRLTLNLKRFIGSNVTVASDFLHQVDAPIVVRDPDGRWTFTIKAKDKNTGFYRATDKSIEMTLEFVDDNTSAKLNLSPMGNMVSLDAKTFVKHRNEDVMHGNPAVFSKDWIKKAVEDPLEVALMDLAAAKLGEPIMIDELGQWFASHADLVRANPKPAEYHERSVMFERSMKDGTYYTATTPSHHSLESEECTIFFTFEHQDQNQRLKAHLQMKSVEGEYVHEGFQLMYETADGHNQGSRYWKNSMVDKAELLRLQRIYAPVFEKLRTEKEEQEAAQSADTPVH